MERFNYGITTSPQTYLLEWSNNGWGFGRLNVDVIQLLETTAPPPYLNSGSSWGLQKTVSIASTTPPPLVYDVKLYSPFPNWLSRQKSEDVMSEKATAATTTTVRGDRVYQFSPLKRGSKTFELFEGDSSFPAEGSGEKSCDVETGGKLMEMKQEGCWDCTSTYADSTKANSAVMGKSKEEGGEPFWSPDRSFNDYDGVHYKIRTLWLEDLTIIRTQDSVPVARFVRSKCSLREIGKLTILVPVKPSFLHLLLCTTFMKYLQDRGRRQQIEMGAVGVHLAVALTVAH